MVAGPRTAGRRRCRTSPRSEPCWSSGGPRPRPRRPDRPHARSGAWRAARRGGRRAVAEQRRRQRRVDEAGSDQVDRTGASLSARLAVNAGRTAVAAEMMPRFPHLYLPSAGAAHEQQEPPRPDPAAVCRRPPRASGPSCARAAPAAPRRVHLEQRRVVGPPAVTMTWSIGPRAREERLDGCRSSLSRRTSRCSGRRARRRRSPADRGCDRR